jgi:type I restriction enzyme S subunit
MKQGWEIKKLGEVCSITMGQSPSSDTYNDSEGLPFFQGNADFGKIHPSIRVYCNAPIRIADVDDILISVRAPIGAINIADCKCCIGRGLASIKNNAEVANEYIYHALVANKEKLIAQGTGSTFKSIGREALKDLQIPIPPREEQERIVAELDCLSGVIEKKREQLKELDALAQSIFYQMFGDPNTNDRNWDVVKLNTTCDNLDYQRRPITAKDRIEGGIPYYGASGVVDYVQDYIFDGDYLLVSEDGANLEVRHTPIAFSIKGKTWVNNHAHILKFEHYCTQLFMEYYINLLDISDIITGCAQPKLTQANLNSIDVFDISIEKQQEFAEKIEAIERQKKLIKKSISEVEDLFNSRMSYYFN